jgi:hypothetical protein
VSDDAGENDQLEPSAVLAAAVDRLVGDGHADLAAAVQRVSEYLRDLAAAHTEIALASDRVIQRGDALLSTAPAEPPTATDRRSGDVDLRAG